MYYYKNNKNTLKLPIIIIPGLFGSLGNDIIPGTGKFNFGMAENVYRPLINSLGELGYKEEENLFIAFYDWRKSCAYNTEKYLIPKIEEAKVITMKNKVDIIGHSLGGIVARTYVQGLKYNQDVRNLIMISTPNAGAVNAYYFWSGGQLPYDKLEKNALYKLIKAGFLLIYGFLYGKTNEINIIRDMFPVAEELLPSFDYGDYLFYDDDSKIKNLVPISNMESKNRLLNELNSSSNMIFNRGIKPYQIIGIGTETPGLIYVNRSNRRTSKWKDGKPIHSISMPYGDGTVISSSAEAIYSKNYYLNASHGDILKLSKDVLASILRCPIISRRENKGKTESNYLYSIIFRNVSTAEIKFSNTEKILSLDGDTTTKNVINRRISNGLHWIMINSKEIEKIEITLEPTIKDDCEIVVFFADSNGQIKMTRKILNKDEITVNLHGANWDI